MTKPFKLGGLWGDAGNYVDGNTLSVYMRRLREKVEAGPSLCICLRSGALAAGGKRLRHELLSGQAD
jgi:hypothetical protein